MNAIEVAELVRFYANKPVSASVVRALMAEAEDKVVATLGGAANPALKQHVLQTLKFSIRSEQPFLVLPSYAGPVIDGGLSIENQPARILTGELERAFGDGNSLWTSAVQEGNVLRFPAIGAYFRAHTDVPQVTARVTFERSVQGTVFDEGLYVDPLSEAGGQGYQRITYGYGGVAYPVFYIAFPSSYRFPSNLLAGGVMRVQRTASEAWDYEIMLNGSVEDKIWPDDQVPDDPSLAQSHIIVCRPDYRVVQSGLDTFSTMTRLYYRKETLGVVPQDKVGVIPEPGGTITRVCYPASLGCMRLPAPFRALVLDTIKASLLPQRTAPARSTKNDGQ